MSRKELVEKWEEKIAIWRENNLKGEERIILKVEDKILKIH